MKSLKKAMYINQILLLLLTAALDVRGDEATLFNTLFTGYNKNVRPRVNASDTVNVELEFELHTITDLDEVNQVMKTVGFIVAIWYDDYLTWTPSDHGSIDFLIVPPTSVWLPDMGVENSADTFYHDAFARDFRVRLSHEGRITWAFGGEFATMCSLDMTFYPFDKQSCELRIENWAYDVHQVSLTNITDHVATTNYESNGIWEFTDSEVEYTELYYDIYPNDPFPELIFRLLLTRKPAYYLLNIVAPCALIIVIALMVFWLPPESGEKVSLGITVLLAFSVFQIIVAENTPKNSDYSPVLGVMVISIMCLSTLSVLGSIAVLYLFHHHTQTRPHRILRKITFKFLARIMCMRLSVPEYEEDKISPQYEDGHAVVVENVDSECTTVRSNLKKMEAMGLEMDDLKNILNNLTFIRTNIENKEKDEEIASEWRGVATVVDRLLFWISLIIVVIIMITILAQRDSDH